MKQRLIGDAEYTSGDNYIEYRHLILNTIQSFDGFEEKKESIDAVRPKREKKITIKMAAWPLRIFALLLVCAYGFGASELFQESAHGEVVDELMQRGHQRHLLQEPPGGKGGTPGVEGAPAATGDGGAKGEKTAEETAEPTTNSTGNGLVAAQIASAQAERMKVIDCELTNSRLETELMGHQDKLEPLGAKNKKVSLLY